MCLESEAEKNLRHIAPPSGEETLWSYFFCAALVNYTHQFECLTLSVIYVIFHIRYDFQRSNKRGTCNIICWNSKSNAFYMHVSYNNNNLIFLPAGRHFLPVHLWLSVIWRGQSRTPAHLEHSNLDPQDVCDPDGLPSTSCSYQRRTK